MEKENIVFQRMADYVNRTIHLGEFAKEIRMTNVFCLLKKQYDRAVAAIRRVIGNYSLGNMILFWLFQYFTFTLLQEGAVLYAGYQVLVSGTMVFAQMAVFDEPSSALDPIAEHHLFENIREYGKDKILFFISHRLSSVRDADEVFYLKNERIRERGSTAN